MSSSSSTSKIVFFASSGNFFTTFLNPPRADNTTSYYSTRFCEQNSIGAHSPYRAKGRPACGGGEKRLAALSYLLCNSRSKKMGRFLNHPRKTCLPKFKS